jgi:hypothetical protein
MAIRYLTTGEVVAINEAEVGPNLLADFGLLESAVLRPQQTAFGADAYQDVHSKAAALLHSLVNNHPFVDGDDGARVLADYFCGSGGGLTSIPRASSASGDQPASSP